MSEPISGTVAGIAGWSALSKLGSLAVVGGIATGIGSWIVMTMAKPQSEKEWRIMLASTIAGSMFGGAAFIKYFNLVHWIDDFFGIMGIGGVMLTCGLPAWLIIRGLFKYAEKNKDKDIKEIIQDVKEII